MTITLRGTKGSALTQAELDGNFTDLDGRETAHAANTSNPHATTKAQVGLGNVDNTSDLDKPVSTATASAIALATATSFPFSYSPNVTLLASATGSGVQVAAFVITVPGGLMGPNSKMIISTLMALGSSGNGFQNICTIVWPASETMATGKVLGERYGLGAAGYTGYLHRGFIENAGSTKQQNASDSTSWVYDIGQSNALQSIQMDTDLDWNIGASCQFASADATTFTVKSMFIQFIP